MELQETARTLKKQINFIYIMDNLPVGRKDTNYRRKIRNCVLLYIFQYKYEAK